MDIDRQILFFSVFFGVLALINLYVYRRFFRRIARSVRKAGAFLMLAVTGGEAVFVTDAVAGLFPDLPVIHMTLGALTGITFMLFVAALIYDLSISVSQRLPFSHERRRAVKTIFDTAMPVAAASYICLGFSKGLERPRVNHVMVRMGDFPVNGFTIVQLSDLHIGHALKRDFLEEVVSRTNAMKPDMVAVTGDLFDMRAGDVAGELTPLKALDAPAFFVTGNHEYYHGVASALKTVRSLGVETLTNRAVRWGNDGASFNLVGLNDPTGENYGIEGPDVETAYRNADPSRPTIVLAHQPRLISQLEGRRCDLMLSGHTHGGQIFPFGLLVMLDQPYVAGLHEHRPGQRIFVSRGTGYWGPPLRVLAPSEISRIVINR